MGGVGGREMNDRRKGNGGASEEVRRKVAPWIFVLFVYYIRYCIYCFTAFVFLHFHSSLHHVTVEIYISWDLVES